MDVDPVALKRRKTIKIYKTIIGLPKLEKLDDKDKTVNKD